MGALTTLLKPPPLQVPKERPTLTPPASVRLITERGWQTRQSGNTLPQGPKCIMLHGLTEDRDLGETCSFSLLLSDCSPGSETV